MALCVGQIISTMSTAPWSVWKDIAYPGRVVVPHPQKPNALIEYDFKSSDMAALEKSGNAKIREGWHIPLCWEHQDVYPERDRLSHGERERDFALGVFGSIERFSRTPDGRLKALIAGTDPSDFEQLRKVKFVSPQIDWNWRDTDGRVWSGPTVTHLAATARPVQRHQHPIGANPDSPPLRQNHLKIKADSLPQFISLSLGSGPRVGHTIRLSWSNWFPGEKQMEGDDLSTGGNSKQTPWERIAASLLKCNVKIGDGKNVKDADHLADLIDVACMNSEPEPLDDLPPEEEDEGGAPEGDMEGPPEGATEPPPPPVQMSIEAQRQIAARDEAIIDNHRRNLRRRVKGLEKRFAPTIVNAVAGEVMRARLSLNANLGLEPHPVVTKIETLELAAKNGGQWSPNGSKPAAKPGAKPPARLSQRGTKKAPASPYAANAEESEEQAEAGADAFFATTGSQRRQDSANANAN